MARVTRLVRATAFRRGVLGASRGWFALWVGIGLARFVRTRLGKDPVVVDRVVLGAGESVVVTDTGIARRDFPWRR